MKGKIIFVTLIAIAFCGVYLITHTERSVTIQTDTTNIEVIEYNASVQEMLDTEPSHRISFNDVMNYTNPHKEHNIYILTNHHLYVFYLNDDEIYYYENKNLFVVEVEILNDTIVCKYTKEGLL